MECLAMQVSRELKAAGLIDVLGTVVWGVPENVRFNNGPGVRGQGRSGLDFDIGAKIAYTTRC
jgi:hypothetical protein